ncbi:choline ABC transporter ATP-binding protein [Inquilinus sp. CAU 1745]|uniref:choline ABC transporter ATP-binding protein n=1 Tax=Inquilinus sp. CAU 1745 TaxID=3140369 RepID=UPI00325C0DCF
MTDNTIVRFDHVDVVFGPSPSDATTMLDQGKGRSEILSETGNTVAVHDANLDIRDGELCVLMGLSGSGKSSLLRCVNGLNPITRGGLTVRQEDGREVDVATCGAGALRRLRSTRVSMVFQQFALMPWRTIRDNVALGLELRGVSKAERRETVDRMLSLVQLEPWSDKYPRELSGGMQQRVGLARAFATDADILLMDEPFSALDPLIRGHLQDELLDLQQSLKKTIIFVSHDLDEALKLGNRIAIMESGQIVQVGTPQDIVLNPANDYVENFVANVNPLNVLRGGTLMKPLAALERDGDWIVLDAATGVRCRLDEVDMPVAIRDGDGDGGGERPIVRGGEGAEAGAVCAEPVDLPMRVAVERVHDTRRPVILLDGDGRMVGIIAGEQIVEGLLRHG